MTLTKVKKREKKTHKTHLTLSFSTYTHAHTVHLIYVWPVWALLRARCAPYLPIPIVMVAVLLNQKMSFRFRCLLKRLLLCWVRAIWALSFNYNASLLMRMFLLFFFVVFVFSIIGALHRATFTVIRLLATVPKFKVVCFAGICDIMSCPRIWTF